MVPIANTDKFYSFNQRGTVWAKFTMAIPLPLWVSPLHSTFNAGKFYEKFVCCRTVRESLPTATAAGTGISDLFPPQALHELFQPSV